MRHRAGSEEIKATEHPGEAGRRCVGRRSQHYVKRRSGPVPSDWLQQLTSPPQQCSVVDIGQRIALEHQRRLAAMGFVLDAVAVTIWCKSAGRHYCKMSANIYP